MATPESKCTARTSPASLLVLLAALVVVVLGMVAAWCSYFAFDRVMSWGSSEETFILIPRAPLVVWLLSIAAGVWLGWLFHRGPDRRVGRFALLQLPWAIVLVPYVLLSPGGMTTDVVRVFVWRILPGLGLVAGLSSSAYAVWPALAALMPEPRPGWRLWVVFFLLAHLPALWFVKPWMPQFYQQGGIGGDEPEILLLTHSLATDFDFNLYNNRVLNHRDEFISPSNPTMGGSDEFYAARAAKWGAGPPQSTPEYWETRRFNMYRPGLGLAFAPGYRLGLKWGRHQRYGVVVMLSLFLTAAMANIFLLVRRATGRPLAALLAALTTGLSGPMMFYGVAAYPDPVDAALLIFALRMLYDLWRDRREGIVSSIGAHIGAGLAISYMPWVHEKMLGFSILMLLAYFIAARPRWTAVTLVLSFVTISVLLQMRYYWILYGHVYPAYVHPEPFSLSYLKQGGWGLLLDRDRGIMDVAPWFIAGVLGLLLWVRREPAFAGFVLFLAGLFWITTASFGGWYGGACAQPRYLTNIMPLFGVGLGLAWQRAARPGARAFLLALCAVGVVQGVSGVLVPDKMGLGPSMLGIIFPTVFGWVADTELLVLAWIAALAWICGFLLLARPRWVFAALAVPVALFIVSAAWFGRDVYEQVSIHRGFTPRLVELLRGPLPLDAAFNRRITMHRWLTLHDPRTPQAVPEVAAMVEAEAIATEDGTKVADAAAGGGAYVTACGRKDGVSRFVGRELQTMHEGAYRADFRVRGRKASEGSDLILAVTRKLDLSKRVAECRLHSSALTPEWQDVAVPFTLATPTRFVGAIMELDGRACADADFVKFSYIAPPAIALWRY